MNLYEIEGTYGRSKTVNINYTYDDIQKGVDIEELSDSDMFTASKPINSLKQLQEAVES